jgi:hypothetical protein
MNVAMAGPRNCIKAYTVPVPNIEMYAHKHTHTHTCGNHLGVAVAGVPNVSKPQMAR